jgi:histone H4
MSKRGRDDEESEVTLKKKKATQSQGQKRAAEEAEEIREAKRRLIEAQVGPRSAHGGKVPRPPTQTAGIKQPGFVRMRKVLRNNLAGVTKHDVRRLARRGGVKRINGLCYEETRKVLKNFLEDVMRSAISYTEHARRKTVTVMDVVYALKNTHNVRPVTLYGYA